MKTKAEILPSLNYAKSGHSGYSLGIFWSFIIVMILFLGYLIFEHFYFGYTIKNSVLLQDLEISKDQLIQYHINRNILYYLSIFSPIILAVFSGLFGLFTYTTNQNLKKSESILQGVQIYSEQNKREYQNLVETYEKNTAAYLERFQSDMKNIRLYPSELTRQILILFNGVIPKKRQPKIDEVIYLLDLIDEVKASKACLYLKERGSKNSIPFMKEYQKFFTSSNVNLAKQIKTAIDGIEKREEKKKNKTEKTGIDEMA